MKSSPKAKCALTFVGDLIPPLTLRTRARAEAGSKKRRFCKRLAKQFQRDRFTYRLIAREGNAAIYEQTWLDSSEPSLCYEVIRIRRRDGFQIGERFVPPAEVYPNAEAWGLDGFTFTNKDAVFQRLKQWTE